MEELRQREANLTALQAIGPRKKPKLDVAGSTSSPGSTAGANASASGLNRQMPMRPRLKRVNFKDLLFLLEQEKETCRSTTLYKSYLKWCSAMGRNFSDPPEIWRRIFCVVSHELASMDPGMDRATLSLTLQCTVFYKFRDTAMWNSHREIGLGIRIHSNKFVSTVVDTKLPLL